MYFIDNRPVYRNKDVPKSFDNSLYFYSRFHSNCPICISYHMDPCIIPCGHSFCSECLKKLSEFSKNCPVCSAFYWASKPVRFFFLEEIKIELLFKRLNTQEVANAECLRFFDYPYSCHYYDSGTEEQTTEEGSSVDAVQEKQADAVITNGDITLYPLKAASQRENVMTTDRLVISRAQGSWKKSSGTNDGSAKNYTFYQSADGQLYFLNPKTYKKYKALPEFIFGKIKHIHHCQADEARHPEFSHVPSNFQIHIVTIY